MSNIKDKARRVEVIRLLYRVKRQLPSIDDERAQHIVGVLLSKRKNER